jgi:hypothetical protein
LKGSKEHGYIKRGVSGSRENLTGFGSAFEKSDFAITGQPKTSSLSRPVYLNNKG